jgi:hypothetical protein
MVAILGILAGSFLGAVVFGSFFEWSLHRYLMHGRWIKGYPYRTHDQVHHKVFDSGPNYHLGERDDHDLVTMAWWNGPVLMLANAPLPTLVAWLAGSWWVIPGAMAAYVLYYAAYEYLHWCMHVPRERWFERTRLYKWIDRHHRLHHLEPDRNLNVVLPLADWILRTRIARAPIP